MSMLALVAALAVQTPPSSHPVLSDPASAEAVAVMEPVEGVFAALAARDGERLRPHLAPEARMIVVDEGADGVPLVRLVAVETFAAGLRPGPERYEEIMPDPILAIDGDIAMVWGRYIFTIDGLVSHCGSNHFDLVRRDGVWRITGLTWNQRTTGCEG